MKKYIATAVLALAATCVPLIGASQIAGSLKFLSVNTNEEIKSIRIGKSLKIKLTERDLHLLANKNVTLAYVLSIVPKGSNTPIAISGKFVARATLPASEGGAAKTRQEMASLEGIQSFVGIVTVPEFMPVGVATVTVSLASGSIGAISFNKTINILL